MPVKLPNRSQRRLRNALLLACLATLPACATAGKAGVTVAVGAVYLHEERANIYVTEEAREIKDCRLLKPVEARTFWGGLFLQDQALEKTISDLTHEAVESGANVLLIRTQNKSFLGSSSTGEAYRCPSAHDTHEETERPIWEGRPGLNLLP